MELDPILTVELLQVLYPTGRVERMGESSTQAIGELAHRLGRAQPAVKETGPVEWASFSRVGNPPILIDEEEEEGKGEDVREEEEGEGNDDEQQKVFVEVAKSKKKKNKAIPPVENAINVTVDGNVGVTRSIMTASKLDALKIKYNISGHCILREPTDNEVACSNPNRLMKCVCTKKYLLG